MIDLVCLSLCSGSGGSGFVSFRREKYVPRGGPSGGSGGPGGSVFFAGSSSLLDLSHLKVGSCMTASSGGNGKGSNKQGGRGKDLVVTVPLGTYVSFGDESGRGGFDVILDSGRQLVILGGEGGRGNRAFASPQVQVPRLAEAGETGFCVEMVLDFKIISDIAIFGPPNAGKTSFLNRVTTSAGKIADYPLTTLEPVKAIYEEDWKQYSMVEIPSSWFNASIGECSSPNSNVLKHTERSLVLLLCLDSTSPTLMEDHAQSMHGLMQYGFDKNERHLIIALTKSDSFSDNPTVTRLKDRLNHDGIESHLISSTTGEGVEGLLSAVVRSACDPQLKPAERNSGLEVPTKPRHKAVRITQSKETFLVTCENVERIVKGTDIREWEAKVQLMNYLNRAGVNRELERAGAKVGDTVRIGDMQFELQ